MSSMPKRKCFAPSICVISDQKVAVNFTGKRQKEKTVQNADIFICNIQFDVKIIEVNQILIIFYTFASDIQSKFDGSF